MWTTGNRIIAAHFQTCCLWVALVVWYASPASSLAQVRIGTTGQIGFITQPVAGRQPLSVAASLDGARATGGRDIKVVTLTVSSLSKPNAGAITPSTMDRNLTAVVYIGRQRSSNLVFRVPIVLPQGSDTVRQHIAFIPPSARFAWTVDLYEDGRKLPPAGQSSDYAIYQETNAATLLLGVIYGPDDDLQALHEEIERLGDSSPVMSSTPYGVQVGPDGNRVVPVIRKRRQELAADWRFFAPVGVWGIQADQLEAIMDEAPDVHRALRQYIASGGNLVVMADQIPRHTVNRFVGAPTGRHGDLDREQTGATGQAANKKTDGGEPRDLGNDEVYVRRHATGYVFATPPISSLSTQSVDLLRKRITETNRETAVSPEMDDDWLLRQLVEGVGKPPVWAFCVIVGLFTLLIGPGLLWITGRLDRRTSLVWLVPATSLVAAVLILAYNVLYVGFVSSARLTSVTRVSTDTGAAFYWTRQTVFSGTSRTDGVELLADALARPVEQEWSWGSYDNPRTGHKLNVWLLPDRQVWFHWPRARQHQQLLIMGPTQLTAPPLRLRQIKPKEVEVTNLMAADAVAVIARDFSGNYYFVENLPTGKSAVLRAESLPLFGGVPPAQLNELVPRVPVELVNSNSLWATIFGREYLTSYTASDSTPPNDVIGTALSRYLLTGEKLQPGEFLMVVRKNSAVPKLLPDARYDELHLIIGSGRW